MYTKQDFKRDITTTAQLVVVVAIAIVLYSFLKPYL